MWRHSSHYFDHVSVSFLWNKESQQEFLAGEKIKYCFLFSGLCSYFLLSFVPLSFLSWKTVFLLNGFSIACDNWSLIYVICFLLIDWSLIYVIRFLLIVGGVHDHFKTLWDNHSKYLFCFSCSYSTCSVCNNWTRILGSCRQTKTLFCEKIYSEEDAGKEKIVV